MLIHKGERFEIFSDGEVAIKSDGVSSRSMRFFPERDVCNIAGELDEYSAWRLLHDIAKQAQQRNTPISPDHILIDGDGFYLSEWSESVDLRFRAPEGYSDVWALGAAIFFVFLGCHVFQSRGGSAQSPSSPIPVLRRELPELSSLIARCLHYLPQKRPSLQEITELAFENMNRCKDLPSSLPPLKSLPDAQVSNDRLDALWPDEW